MRNLLEYIIGWVGLALLEKVPLASSSAGLSILLMAVGLFVLWKVWTADAKQWSDNN